MAQSITLDELSGLGGTSGSVQSALEKMAAALQTVGDAGGAARQVLEELRQSLRDTAAQSTKSARTLAKFDEIQRLAAPQTEETSAAKKSTSGSSKKSGGSSAKRTAEAKTEAEAQRTIWQSLLEDLQGLWSRFWEYLKTFYAPAIAAWQAAWQQIAAAAQTVWGPVKAAALALWNEALLPLAQYLATVFLPGVVNSFSQAFAPIVGGVVATAITVLGDTFVWLCDLLIDAVNNVVRPALDLLLTIWQGLMAGIQNAWSVYGQPLLDGVVLAFENLTDLLSTLWQSVLKPVLLELIAQVGALWTDCLEPLWQQLTLALGAVMNLLLTLWNTLLAPLINWLIATFGPVFTQVFAAVADAVRTAVTVVGGAVTAALAMLRGLADFVSGVLVGNWQAAWQAMANAVQTVWATITATVENAVSGLISLVQNMAGAIGSAISGILSAISGAGRAASGAIASAGNWLAGRSAAPNLAYARALPVPALAAGAVIPPNRTFLALLGDQRSGTNVEAPLATIQQAVADVMQDLQDGELAALEQVAAQLQQILEAIYGIRIGDEVIGRAADRYRLHRAVVTGRG